MKKLILLMLLASEASAQPGESMGEQIDTTQNNAQSSDFEESEGTPPAALVEVFSDSWKNFMNTFVTTNPNNLPFNQWKLTCLGNSKKMSLTLDDSEASWHEFFDFFSSNHNHLSPDNFMIVTNQVFPDLIREHTGNTNLLKYVTEVKRVFGVSKLDFDENFKIFLQNNAQTLSSIMVGGVNTFSPNQVAYFVHFIALYAPKIKILKVGMNSSLTLQEAKNLVYACNKLTSLEELDLSHNSLGCLGVFLGDCFKNLVNLKNVNLSNSSIDAPGALNVVLSLKHLVSLESFDLSNSSKVNFNSSKNTLEDDGGNALLDSLPSLTKLKELKLKNNHMSEECQTKIKNKCDELGITLEL